MNVPLPFPVARRPDPLLDSATNQRSGAPPLFPGSCRQEAFFTCDPEGASSGRSVSSPKLAEFLVGNLAFLVEVIIPYSHLPVRPHIFYVVVRPESETVREKNLFNKRLRFGLLPEGEFARHVPKIRLPHGENCSSMILVINVASSVRPVVLLHFVVEMDPIPITDKAS